MAQEDRVEELANALDGKSEPASEPTPDQPEATPEIDAGKEDAPEREAPAEDDSFYELDLSSVPEDADREWLARRHKEMQAAFTKKTTSLAEQRREAEKITAAFNDPETLAYLLRERGYELDDDDSDDDEFAEFDEEPTQADFRTTREWQEFQQFQQQLHEAAAQEQQEQGFRAAVKDIETREGREVDDDEWELLWNLSEAGVHPDQGFERISNLRKQERRALVKSKDAPRVAQGQSATQVPDLSDEQARVDYLAEQIEAKRRD